jgi:5-methylcytosine-specific restriction endonuclease McrA
MSSLIRRNRWRWSQLRAAILVRDGYRCQICRDPACEVDHIAERRAGGGDAPANLR